MKQEKKPEYHPAAPQVAKYLVEQLNTAQRQDLRTTELHIVSLIKEIWFQFPQNYIKVKQT